MKGEGQEMTMEYTYAALWSRIVQFILILIGSASWIFPGECTEYLLLENFLANIFNF